ncbi:unnamed protein product [Cuscuta epithymum]|uniref:Uncharacterized protein n=1 Tax=Cuscuta epithymum TaxID=186058 RepID=A0AAV0C9K2_9ASTE|nr:unnamed protein product [Cuscuta epithymum]
MDRPQQPRLPRRLSTAVYRPPAAPAPPRPVLFRPQVAAALRPPEITTPAPPPPPPPPPPTATGVPSSDAVDLPPLPNPSATPPPLPESDKPPAKTVTFSSRSPPPSPRKEAVVKTTDESNSDERNPVSDPPLKQPLPPSSEPETESGGRGRVPAEENDLGVVKEEITESRGTKGVISEGKAQGHEGMSGDSSESSGKMTTTTKVKDHNHRHRSSDADNNSSGTSSIITLAGENKGAIMELSPMRAKHGFIGIPLRLQQERTDGDENGGKSLKTGEKRSNNDDNRRQPPTARAAFVNNNVQGVNNSFMHGTSIHHHDPGVHLCISSKHGSNRYVKNP